jgi:hypothetical protein
MAKKRVRIGFASYLGGIPGRGRKNRKRGTLHLGPTHLYVSRDLVMGVSVLGAKFGKVAVDEISAIDVDSETVRDAVAIGVHLKDGSTGLYEVRWESRESVLSRLRPVALQLGIRIPERVTTGGLS